MIIHQCIQPDDDILIQIPGDFVVPAYGILIIFTGEFDPDIQFGTNVFRKGRVYKSIVFSNILNIQALEDSTGGLMIFTQIFYLFNDFVDVSLVCHSIFID